LTFRALACDYDRTLATDATILPDTLNALTDLKEAGWLVLLVTGRELDDLLRVCPSIELFNLVVAENGAVLYAPEGQKIVDLAAPPALELTRELASQGVPFSAGRIIIDMQAKHAANVLSIIQRLRLKMQVILNKDSAMVLPAGVNKASGMTAAANRLGVKLDEIVGVGDAENDHEFLRICGFGVAVANALDALKAEADLVTTLPNGAGVTELIREHLLKTGGQNLCRRLG
jgi:phosphoglycolate phosphatase (TIGR01487 family)